MDADPRVGDLLLQWEELHEQGKAISVDELCRVCPELLGEVRRRIEALQRMDGLLQPQPAIVGATADLSPAVPPTQATTVDLAAGPAPPALLPRVPGYEVLRELGRGGMGVVYLARQISLNRPVALKMLLAAAYSTEQQRRRFRAEAEVVARLQHPNIVQVYEVGEADGRPFCALEYIDGPNLADALDGKPVPPRSAAELAATLADAVQTAHARGVVHRDLKPGNVLLQRSQVRDQRSESTVRAAPSHDLCPLTSDLRPKITDFGLAKILTEDARLTATGDVLGTPTYMAPEQAAGRNREVGPASDLYSLGAILYELLTGRPPLLGSTTLETLQLVARHEPLPPRRLQPHTPRDMDTICIKCLQKAPARRYASAGELADDLRRFLAGEPIRARPIGAAERLVRWCKRRPAVAALTAAVFLLLAATAITASIAYVRTDLALAGEAKQRREAERLRGETENQRGAAVAARDAAHDEAVRMRRLLYAADMGSAEQMWESEQGSARRMDELLAAWNDRPGDEDLRELSWRYVWGLLHDGRVLRDRSFPRLGASTARGELTTIDTDDVLWVRIPATGNVLSRIPLRQGDASLHIDLDASGSVAAVLTDKGSLSLIDAVTGWPRWAQAAQGDSVHWAPGGRRVVVRNTADETARVWDASTGAPIGVFQTTGKDIDGLQALSPDGATLAVCSAPGRTQVFLRDLGTKVRRHRIQTHVTLECLAFSPDGKTLVGADMAGRVYVWDTTSGDEKRHYDVHFGTVTCVAFSDDGRQLASGSQDGIVVLTDLESGDTLFRTKGHTDAVTFVALSPDGQTLTSGGRDGRIRFWDLARPPGPRRLRDGGGRIMDLVCSPDGKWLAAVQGSQLVRYDLHTEQFAAELTAPRPLSRLAFTPDGKLLAAGDDRGAVHLWNVDTGTPVRTLVDWTDLDGDESPGVAALTISPNGKLLVTGHGALGQQVRNYAQFVRIWDLDSGKVIRTFPHGNEVDSAAFSADGALLATGCADGKVRTWNVADWQPGRTWTAPARVMSMALSPHGDLVAAGLSDGAICVWETGSDKLVWVMKGHVRRVAALAFTPDGKTLLSVGEDHTVRLWHMASGRSLLVLHGPTAPVWSLAVTPDGDTFASGDREGGVLLWHAPSFARIEELKAADGR